MKTIVSLMEERKHLFSEFLKASNAMVSADIETLEEIDKQREALKNQINILDLKIKNVYENRSDADIISRVIKNKIDSHEVSSEYQDLYEIAQQTFTDIFQALNIEKQISKHLNDLRDQTLEEIKASSNVSKITKYLNAFDDKELPEGSLLSKDARNA